MIVQLFLNDNDLKTFFENAGYTTDMVQVSEFTKATHGFSAETPRDVLHVVDRQGNKHKAKEVFEDVMKLRAVHTDKITIQQIKRVLNDN